MLAVLLRKQANTASQYLHPESDKLFDTHY